MSKIKVASFNLLNLQLPDKTTYYGAKPYKTEAGMTQSEAFTYKVNWIGDILYRIGADIIAFQEIWDTKSLETVFESNSLNDDYELITTNGIESGISVGLAYRKDIFKVVRNSTKWIKPLPKELVLKKYKRKKDDPNDYGISIDVGKFSRAILKTTLLYKEKQEKITIYVAHFKSKIPMKFEKSEMKDLNMGAFAVRNGKALSSIRRIVEAAGLRILLDKQMKGTHDAIIVMGDLNDDESSDTLDIVTDTPNYRLSITSTKGRMSDKGLYTAAAMSDYASRKDVLYSYIYQGKRSMLDHILFSEQFYDESKNRKWSFEQFRVINDFLDDDNSLESDHGIPVITFKYNPF